MFPSYRSYFTSASSIPAFDRDSGELTAMTNDFLLVLSFGLFRLCKMTGPSNPSFKFRIMFVVFGEWDFGSISLQLKFGDLEITDLVVSEYHCITRIYVNGTSARGDLYKSLSF